MGYFLPFYPPNSPKNENFKKIEKLSWVIIILHKCAKNHDHMLYCSSDMTHVIAVFHLGLFFALLPPKQPKKSKFYKNEKIAWTYHHFTRVHQKLWLDDVQFLRHGAWQTDGQTDGQMEGQKKWHIEVGATPKNEIVNSC